MAEETVDYSVGEEEGQEVLRIVTEYFRQQTDTEEDAQKCLEEALRALELNRTKSNNEGAQLKSMSDDASDATSLSCNPSDEESALK